MSLDAEQQTLFDLEHKKLLLDEPPLQVLPSLACAIGLHEAIVLQQLHFRLRDKARRRLPKRMGRYWIYNSYKEWQREEFPFFSVRTVERIFTERLERTFFFNQIEINKLVLTEQLEKRERDRRKWYSIDYHALTILEREITAAEHANMADSEHANMADSERANMADSEHANMADSKTTKTTHKDINKDTHTQETQNRVSVRSKFSLRECLEYVTRCVAKGQTIKSPEGLALTLHRNGEADTLIEAVLYPERFEQTQKEIYGEPRQFTDQTCHVCNGSLFEIVEGKGARPCPHCVDERGKRHGKEPLNNGAT